MRRKASRQQATDRHHVDPPFRITMGFPCRKAPPRAAPREYRRDQRGACHFMTGPMICRYCRTVGGIVTSNSSASATPSSANCPRARRSKPSSTNRWSADHAFRCAQQASAASRRQGPCTSIRKSKPGSPVTRAGPAVSPRLRRPSRGCWPCLRRRSEQRPPGLCWLDAVEGFFAKLTRRKLQHGARIMRRPKSPSCRRRVMDPWH